VISVLLRRHWIIGRPPSVQCPTCTEVVFKPARVTCVRHAGKGKASEVTSAGPPLRPS
jgi:hypothetical protein